MADDNQSTTFRERFWFLILDKLLFAAVLVFVGYLFNGWLQRTQMTMDYQRVLFDKRREAYVDLLTKAKQARDAFIVFYGQPSSVKELKSSEFVWGAKLGELRSHFRRQRSSGASDFWFAEEEQLKNAFKAIEALEDLEQIRHHNALYLSAEIDQAVDQFIAALWSDMAILAKDYDREQTDVKFEFLQQAFIKVSMAYDTLRSAVRKSLRIEAIILG